MENPLVSIIIPAYQQGLFLSECVNSLRHQSYENWEAWIINDGSTDETDLIGSLWAQMEPRIHYIKKPNGGPSSARNIGLARARGEFIQLLDADDQLEPEKLTLHVTALQTNPEKDIVYGNAKYFTEGKAGDFRKNYDPLQNNHAWGNLDSNNDKSIFRRLIERNLFPICTPLIRRSVLEKVGLFDEKLKSHEDWDYWLRCAMLGLKFTYSSRENSDALIRTHPGSLSKNTPAMLSSMFDVRISLQLHLKTLPLRVVNLTHLAWLHGLIGKEVTNDTQARILACCQAWPERLYARVALLGSPGGVLYRWLRKITPFFPAPLRKALGMAPR